MLCCVVLLTVSCETETITNKLVVEENSETAFVITNGYLQFKSENHLIEQLDELSVMNEEELVGWIVEVGFTNSLLLNYYGNEDEPAFLLNKYDMALHYAAVMSNEGVLAAGDTIAVFKDGIEYAITDGNTELLNKILAGREFDSSELVINDKSMIKAGWTTIYGPTYNYLTFIGSTTFNNRIETELKANIYLWNKYFNFKYFIIDNTGEIPNFGLVLNYDLKERDGSNKCESVSYSNYTKTMTKTEDIKLSTWETWGIWHDGNGGCFCWKDFTASWTMSYDSGLQVSQGLLIEYYDGCRQ